MKRALTLLLCFICLVLRATSSTLQAQVRINEFLIEPDQKVELFNLGDAAVDITGWFIDDSGGSTYFSVPQAILPPNSCHVFEGDFNLNKSSSDSIRLFDTTAPPISPSATLIDSFSYKASSGSGITFKRIPDGSAVWATGSADFGFFNNTSNSCLSISPTSSPTPTPYPSPTPTPAVSVIIENIYISEALVNPETGEKEWVELYNGNGFEITLTRWFIDDDENGGSKPKPFTLSIGPLGYSVLELGSSLFNNDGDSIRLLDNSEVVRDSFDYLYSEKGKSWGRTSFDTDIFCLQEITRGEKNGECVLDEKENIAKTSSIKKSLSEIVPAKNSAPDPPQYSGTSKASPQPVKQIKVRKVAEGAVLGMGDTLEKKGGNLPRTLSVISLSYSLLTMLSVFLKMRVGMIS